MPENWKRGQKYNQLDEWKNAQSLKWTTLKPDARNTWLTAGEQKDFATMLPLRSDEDQDVFKVSSLGVSTNRDEWVYNFDKSALRNRAEQMFERLASERRAFIAAKDKKRFRPNFSEHYLKWSDTLLRKLKGEQLQTAFEKKKIVTASYRPYCKVNLLLDAVFIDRPSAQARLFPNEDSNRTISLNTSSDGKMFFCLASGYPSDLHFTGDSVCLPYFTYEESGSNREDNITGSALTEFRSHYSDKKITKWDIFHATYAVLHHPEYRTRYAANLKRELPRIPFPPDFHVFAAAGKRLMELHIDYEKQPEYSLEQLEDPKAEVSFRVERMKLSKDKSELRYNDFLTLRGIPPAAFDYRLGNRSALEWVIDQYRVSTDPRSGIVNDPNRISGDQPDPQYILRLIGQVITVSLETQQIIAALPSINLGSE